jgi:hypothetical protein
MAAKIFTKDNHIAVHTAIPSTYTVLVEVSTALAELALFLAEP